MLLEIIGDNANGNSNEKVFAAQTVRPNELSHYGHLLITQRFDGKHCKYMMTDDIFRLFAATFQLSTANVRFFFILE